MANTKKDTADGAPDLDALANDALEPTASVAQPVKVVNPQQGNLLYMEQNINNWIQLGTSLNIGGGYSVASGMNLGIGTNKTLGYGNGQMLAVAAGNGTGAYAGLVTGSLVNWDPASTDTGQKIWNYMVITDRGMKTFLAPQTTYGGSIQCAAPKMQWILAAQFLYGPGTPTTDAAIVATALKAAATANVITIGQVMCASGSYVQTIAY